MAHRSILAVFFLFSWNAFAQAQAFGVSAWQERTGTLVMTDNATQGGFGGLNGGNAFCLARLTATQWRGKESVRLNSDTVKAFLCDSSSCNNLRNNTSYAFARAGSATAGGATFRTGATGQGPNDTANWSGARYFDSTAIYWSGRGSVSATVWANTGSGSNCTNWTTSSGFLGLGQGSPADPNSTDYERWDAALQFCSSSRPLVCIVHP